MQVVFSTTDYFSSYANNESKRQEREQPAKQRKKSP